MEARFIRAERSQYGKRIGEYRGRCRALEHGIRYVQVGAPEPNKVEELQADLKAKGLQAIGLTALYLEEDTVATEAASEAWINAFDAAVKMGIDLVLSSIKPMRK